MITKQKLEGLASQSAVQQQCRSQLLWLLSNLHVCIPLHGNVVAEDDLFVSGEGDNSVLVVSETGQV